MDKEVKKIEIRSAVDNFVDFMEFTTGQIKAYGRLDGAVLNLLEQMEKMVQLGKANAEFELNKQLCNPHSKALE